MKSPRHIPIRYILAITLSVLEVAAVIGIVVLLCRYIPYFYIAAYLTELFCVLKIVASNDNPDYKVPWLLCTLTLPIAGFMLYFMFYSRNLKPRFIKRLNKLRAISYEHNDNEILDSLSREDELAASTAKMLCSISDSHIFQNTSQQYFPIGEDMHKAMLDDLRSAKSFIFLEYFIIEDGKFWSSILDILKEKAKCGVEVKLIYDDIGCMTTLPGYYYRSLRKYNIDAVPFSRLKGNADGEFNNRSHRKLLVIDGRIGYTGGVNIADEYINEKQRFGHWKDTGIRLCGDAVREMTRLFYVDYGINCRTGILPRCDFFPISTTKNADQGYIIPFGDGPNPLYTHKVSKTLLQNMLATAKKYVYMTSPYLIIDNELCTSIENAALRGVDVRLIIPGIPDKRLVYFMTECYAKRLMASGVRIYKYTPGFIHAKCWITDDTEAVIGTVNLDYRSLVHHFENGAWMYKTSSIRDIVSDINNTLSLSTEIQNTQQKDGLLKGFLSAVIKIFAPML